jgi:hypothetical protein
MALDGGGAAALQLGAHVLDVLVCIYSIRLASSSNIFSIEALRAMSFLVLQHLHGGFGVGIFSNAGRSTPAISTVEQERSM